MAKRMINLPSVISIKKMDQDYMQHISKTYKNER